MLIRRTATITGILAAVSLAVIALAQPPDWPGAPGEEPVFQPRAGRGFGAPEGMRGGFARGIQPPGVPGRPGPGAADDFFSVGEELREAGKHLRPFWRNDELKDSLKLTDEQTETLEKAYTDVRSKLIDRLAEVAHKRLDLQEAMRKDTPDAAQVEKAVEALGDARTELQKTLTGYRVEVQNTLTAEQKEALKEFREEKIERIRERVIERLKASREEIERARQHREQAEKVREEMGRMREEFRGQREWDGRMPVAPGEPGRSAPERNPRREGAFLRNSWGDRDL